MVVSQLLCRLQSTEALKITELDSVSALIVQRVPLFQANSSLPGEIKKVITSIMHSLPGAQLQYITNLKIDTVTSIDAKNDIKYSNAY